MRNLILTLLIWTICFAAITAGLVLIYDWYRHRGVDVKIYFKTVDGLVPKQSKVLYKGVQIGVIKEIILDTVNDHPIVIAKLNTKFAKKLNEETKFWIVRPEVSVGSIENLSTITTGNYIAVEPFYGKQARKFIGLEDDPVEAKINGGLRLFVKSNSVSGLETGSAVLYRGLQIGEIGDMTLSKDKRSILLTIYIDELYKEVIRKNSSFQNISGFHASLRVFGTSYISVDSLRTIIKGGIAVNTNDFSAPAAKEGDIFILLPPEED